MKIISTQELAQIFANQSVNTFATVDVISDKSGKIAKRKIAQSGIEVNSITKVSQYSVVLGGTSYSDRIDNQDNREVANGVKSELGNEGGFEKKAEAWYTIESNCLAHSKKDESKKVAILYPNMNSTSKKYAQYYLNGQPIKREVAKTILQDSEFKTYSQADSQGLEREVQINAVYLTSILRITINGETYLHTIYA